MGDGQVQQQGRWVDVVRCGTWLWDVIMFGGLAERVQVAWGEGNATVPQATRGWKRMGICKALQSTWQTPRSAQLSPA